MTRIRANLLMLVTAAIWGSAFVFQQTSMDTLGPMAFTGARFLLGGLIILPLALKEWRRLKKGGLSLKPRDYPFLFATGLALFLGSACQQIGIQYTTVTNAGFLTGLYVPLTPILVLIVLRHLPHWSIWPAAALSLAGTFLLSGGTLTGLGIGDIWMIIGAFFWATHVILVGYVGTRTGAPLTVATFQFLACAALGFLTASFSEDMSIAAFADTAGGILYTGFLSVGIAYTLQVVAQRHSPAADAAIILSSEALFAALSGALFLGERLSIMEFTGCAAILSGILMVQLAPLRAERKRRRAGAMNA